MDWAKSMFEKCFQNLAKITSGIGDKTQSKVVQLQETNKEHKKCF